MAEQQFVCCCLRDNVGFIDCKTAMKHQLFALFPRKPNQVQSLRYQQGASYWYLSPFLKHDQQIYITKESFVTKVWKSLKVENNDRNCWQIESSFDLSRKIKETCWSCYLFQKLHIVLRGVDFERTTRWMQLGNYKLYTWLSRAINFTLTRFQRLRNSKEILFTLETKQEVVSRYKKVYLTLLILCSKLKAAVNNIKTVRERELW